MGIWLAPLQTRVMDSKLFSCEYLTPEKAQNFISIPDISQPAQNLHKYHKFKLKTGSSISALESMINKFSRGLHVALVMIIFFGVILFCFVVSLVTIFRCIRGALARIRGALDRV